MTPQQIEAMKMALEALKWCHGGEPCGTSEAITALEEALAQPEQEPEEKFCDSNCVWTDHHSDCKLAQPEQIPPSAYSNTHQPEQEEKLPPVEIGVDVTDIGTTVVAFYRRPNAVMEMFYSQFHPLAQPEQEPVACIGTNGELMWLTKPRVIYSKPQPLYTTPPQRTEQKMVMWPCLIDTVDFFKGTVTVVMQCEDYKVSAGTHYLSTTPPKEST